MGYVNYQSGWCVSCGRRRGADGRCVNCDPWWTSPLIQIGGPILAVTALVLVVVTASVTPLRSDPAKLASGGATGARPLVFSAPQPLPAVAALGPLSPPTGVSSNTFPTLPTLPPAAFLPPPDPERAQFEQLEQLRFQVRSAAFTLRQQRAWRPEARPLPLGRMATYTPQEL